MSNSQKNPHWSPPPEQHLTPLSGDELSRFELAPGDIYLRTSAGKLLRLKRAGDFLETSWRARFAKSQSLLWQPIVQVTRVDEIVNLFKLWQAAQDPADVEVAREHFMNAIRFGLRPEGGVKIIDWSFACYQLFNPDQSLVEEFQNKHVVLYRRGMMVSAMAVLLSMSCGYNEPRFLQDIYQTAWLLDAGLIDDRFSYWVALACQAERLQPGGGDILLGEHNVPAAERDLFLDHPRLSYEKAQATFAAKMAYPDLLLSVLRHHEKADGTGFPEGISLSMLSDWETLVIFADNLVDYREEELEQHYLGDIALLWTAFLTRPSVGLPVQRVVTQLKRWLRKPEAEVLSA